MSAENKIMSEADNLSGEEVLRAAKELTSGRARRGDDGGGMKARRIITNSLVHILLGVLGFIWILPICFVILVSFRAEPGDYKSYIIPRGFTVDNYVNLFKGLYTTQTGKDVQGNLYFPRWMANTLVVSIFSCLISAFFVISVSFVMSRLRFKMRKTFLNLALILGMFPGFMSMIAVYYILKGLGFLEAGPLKLVALVLVYSGGAGLGFYIAKGFFDTIPKTIDEAAFIDGATKWDVFWRITMPLSKPIIVSTVLTAFTAPWIDFIFAKVIMGQDREYFTVAIGLWTMLEKEFIQYYYTQFYAGCVIISIPIAIIFLLTQRFYVEGVSGAVKG